jgi:hypothetical protein
MRAIQRHLPKPRHLEIHRITVAAPPDAAWPVARHVDGSQIPWIRFIFDLRELPSKLLGIRPPSERDRRLGVDQVIDNGKGFFLLEEVPGVEVVIGAVGQFWHLEIPFAQVSPRDFASFAEPGWGKLAWAIRVEPFGSGSAIVFELRTSATDEASWHQLDRYFHAIGVASHLIRSSVMGHLEAQLHPLARSEDKHRSLPGDEHVPGARYAFTHAIDIEAPPDLIWPWLMQLGCDRAGWYSIDALDHGGSPSIEQLVPEWASRSVGDQLAATPKGDGHYSVLAVEPQHDFVIGGETDRMGGHVQMSWAFVLEPLGSDATHLVTRVRASITPDWSAWLQGGIFFPAAHALMQHTQLSNLKRLAERMALAR